MYVTLAAAAAAVVAWAQTNRMDVLLILPPASLVLGWTYLVNDLKIAAIQRYVRTDLSSRLRVSLGIDPSVSLFGWEAALIDPRRGQRKAISCGILVITFSGAPLVALLVYWLHGDIGKLELSLSIFEAATAVLLASQFILYVRSPSVEDGA